MINRVVGTNSGIDVDKVVKQSLSKEQNKINSAYQKQKISEYQQQQLRKIVSDGSEFFDNYLDILGKSSMFSSKTYETVKFTSSDEAVTAKGYAGADVTDYKVSVNQLAKKAKTTINSNYFNDAVASGKGVLSFEMKDQKGGASKFAAIDIPIEDGEVNMVSAANYLNIELKKKGIAATAKYSEIANGIVLESNDYGEDICFGIAVEKNAKVEDHINTLNTFTYQYSSGQNSKGSIKKGNYVYIIDKPSNTAVVDNVEFTLNKVSEGTTLNEDDLDHLDESSTNKVTYQSLDKKITSVKQGNRYIFTKSYSDGITLKKVIINGIPETTVQGKLSHLKEDDKGVVVSKDPATDITTIAKVFVDSDGKKQTKVTKIDGNTTTTSVYMNDDSGMTTTDAHDGVVVTTTTIKKEVNGKEEINTSTECTGHLPDDLMPDKHNIFIESEDGKTKTSIVHGFAEDGTSITTSKTIQSQDDGSSIEKTTINGASVVHSNKPIELSGEIDIKNMKDTIIKFVDDYNKLMKSINDKLWEKREKNYLPLTDEQRSEMTDKQAESWEKKAETGLLRSDGDLRRIQQSMKTAMSSLMSGTGFNLEKIGIKPLKDYTSKNGMYEVDENTLTKALESNSEEVRDLFTRKASEKDENGKIADRGGVLTQLKSVLNDEMKSPKSMLSQRIGFEGTSTASNNTLSKSISEQKKLIKELQTRYTQKENALYKKYSNLEVMLEKLNAQQGSLNAMLGIN